MSIHLLAFFSENNADNPATWFQFLKYNSTGRAECLKDFKALSKKEFDTPEALDFSAFDMVNNKKAAKEFRNFCRLKSYGFTCNAWFRMFEIVEPVIPEYVREFLASVDFSDDVVNLTDNCFYFQLGGMRYSLTMKEFILTLRLYTENEMNSTEFPKYYEYCWRTKPENYDPTHYFCSISTASSYNSRHPPSYKLIKSPIRRLVHRLIALSVKARHSAR